MPGVLLIDDNEEILSANKDYLTGQGFTVTCANTGIKALAYLNENKYDCIVLDILLSDLDGFTICKAARTITDTPIMFLSCLDETDDKVNGLMTGGDDYMSKPYSLREMSARITALLRRGVGVERPCGDIYIDQENNIIHVSGKNLLLSEREFKLFTLFYYNPEEVFSKEELLDKIWHGNAESGAVATLVSRLKRKIEFAEEVIGDIINVYGSGYSLVRPNKEIAS